MKPIRDRIFRNLTFHLLTYSSGDSLPLADWLTWLISIRAVVPVALCPTVSDGLP